MANRLLSAIEKNKYVLGPFMKLDSATVVEIAGLAGFDFVILDTEHGPLDISEVENLIRAAHLHDMCAIVRVGENDPLMIGRALDIGADGVQIPQISNKDDACKAVAAAKFYPRGERGVCRYVRAAEFTRIQKQDYFLRANENSSVIVHIEGVEGLKNFEDILDVGEIDVLFIGPYDLSQSLGIPGQTEHPRLLKEIESLIKRAAVKNKAVGIFSESPEGAKRYINLGVQYISYAVDVGMIYDKFKFVVDSVKN